jgi:uncharacterized membrane protein
VSQPCFADDFRRFFLRGLGALIPTLLTLAILLWVYRLVNDHVGVYITGGLRWICSTISAAPAPGVVNIDVDPLNYGTPIDEWNEDGERLTIEYKAIQHGAIAHPDLDKRARAMAHRNEALWQIAFAKYHLNLLGFLIAIILVYFTGFFLASFIGKASWRMAEGVLYRIPLIRAIYPTVKQVTDFLLSERQLELSGVVAVEYPRRGIWSLGLSTGKALGRLQRAVPEELATVFIPSSPTPFTGYVIVVPRKDIIELGMSIDEALRFLISGGVIKPEEGAGTPEVRFPVDAPGRLGK